MLQGYRGALTSQAEAQGLGPPLQPPQLHQGAAAGYWYPVAIAHAGQVNVRTQLGFLGSPHCRKFLVCLYRPAQCWAPAVTLQVWVGLRPSLLATSDNIWLQTPAFLSSLRGSRQAQPQDRLMFGKQLPSLLGGRQLSLAGWIASVPTMLTCGKRLTVCTLCCSRVRVGQPPLQRLLGPVQPLCHKPQQWQGPAEPVNPEADWKRLWHKFGPRSLPGRLRPSRCGRNSLWRSWRSGWRWSMALLKDLHRLFPSHREHPHRTASAGLWPCCVWAQRENSAVLWRQLEQCSLQPYAQQYLGIWV